MALVQYLSEVQGSAEAGTTMLLIDEPELYLHPFAIEQLREALLKLSKLGYQVVISTHSAQMITAQLAEDTLLIYKNEQGTNVRLSLKKAVQQTINNHTHQASFLFSLTQSSQFLFADKIILVEGKTEKTLLPFIFQKIHKKTLGQLKYALISLEGASGLKKSMEIIQAMGLSVKTIADLDFLFKDAVEGNLLCDISSPILEECKAAMKKIGEPMGVEFNDNDLPKKCEKNNMTQTQWLEKFAEAEEVQIYIAKLHEHFKNKKNIWVWRFGAIEKPLGLKGKKDTHWADFQKEVNESSLKDVCKNFEEVESLMHWLIS